MKNDNLKDAIAQARAEVARLETETKTLPFTTDVQDEMNFANNSVKMIYEALGGYRDETAKRGWGETRFKLIDALDTRLKAIERAIFTDDVTDKRTVNDRLAALEATTRMIGEAVFPDDLEDDVHDPLEAQLDALNAEYVCDLKAKIDEQAATIAKLETDLANTVTVPEGYMAVPIYRFPSRRLAGVNFVKKGSAK